MKILEGNYTVILNYRSSEHSLPHDVVTCSDLIEHDISSEVDCCEICHAKTSGQWSEEDVEEEMGRSWIEEHYNGVHTVEDQTRHSYADARTYLCCGCQMRWEALSQEQRLATLGDKEAGARELERGERWT